MALDGYGANYQSAPQGWSPDAKRDVDVNKDGKPNNRAGEDRYYSQVRNGGRAYNDFMNNTYGSTLDNFMRSTDEATALQRNALGGSMFQSMFASDLANRDADKAAERAIGLGEAFTIMGAQDKARDRFETSVYGKDMMGFSADLTNRFANQDFDRGLRGLAASGEDARKTIYAQADAGNTSRVVQGEQDRMLEMAKSDRDVRNYAAHGDQTRKNYRVEGDETRKTDTNRIGQQGFQDRLLTETQGKEERSLERVRSDRDVRKAGAEGFQERLNEETRGKEGRRTIDFSDRIDARREDRQNRRSNRLARAF